MQTAAHSMPMAGSRPGLTHTPSQIETAFEALRELGWTAKGPFKCCTAHGFEAMLEDDIDTNFVFYTEEDAEDLFETSSCFLCWRGDPDVIMKVMAQHALMPIWSRRPQDRIQITWTRRH